MLEKWRSSQASFGFQIADFHQRRISFLKKPSSSLCPSAKPWKSYVRLPMTFRCRDQNIWQSESGDIIKHHMLSPTEDACWPNTSRAWFECPRVGMQGLRWMILTSIGGVRYNFQHSCRIIGFFFTNMALPTDFVLFLTPSVQLREVEEIQDED